MSRFPVRAIDVGFGNTKFVLSEGPAGIECDLFPSLAPVAGETDSLGGGVLAKHRVVPIEIDGVRYAVGKDASLSLSGTSARTLDPTFSRNNEYLALIRGALHAMGASEITLLIVGLPVTTVQSMGPALEMRLTGSHPLHCAGNPPRVVNVHRVKALPQPLGAFIDFATRTHQTERMQRQRNLIIDTGYYTVDWLLCDGLKVIGQRSNAYEGGVSTIVRAIINEIQRVHGVKYSDHTLVDRALRNNKPIPLRDKELPLESFTGLIANKTQEAAAAVIAGIESDVDIQNILLAGGGAELYAPAFQAKFPGRTINIVRDPVFANVRGFQLAGNQISSKSVVAVAR